MNKIILFDGECNFCDRSVQFIIKRDRTATFKFASLQSDIGEKLREKYQIPKHLDSIILIDESNWYSKSTAALKICKNLNGLWKVLYPLLIVPKPLRDIFYNVIARNRYKWFGKKESCELPSPDIRKRFL
ncbi:thiol-disulfide oxidoreductase DCC family protein [Aquibacillus koreensis]|uniref:Thiol-disulfide oxidoreductase DCC family protein n=1 Tax=Aquibacillus koreensis TaxID=279446 RepID=A0A9X3WPL5_9BACI|nr:thiol-disulfide oxidoreductase DCC family protein [Aquibacillus koreensis]MCT2536897.1 thiol-disulfide oxidoreductase DCC family protein [Aquibacillus koreensis]MDC3421971.1 thiol-disulfide oxidoreductase DCC family protein [Aquibacillus koreensis]